MSSAPAWPGSPRAVELAGDGRAVSLYKSGAICRRAVPLVSRCASSAAVSTTATTCCSPATARRSTYLGMIGARDTLEGPEEAAISPLSISTRTGAGAPPEPGADPVVGAAPGPARAGYAAARLPRRRCDCARVGAEATVDAMLTPTPRCSGGSGEPFAVAALNAAVAEGSAALFGRVAAMRRSAAAAAACRPLVAREGLSETFVDPALAAQGAPRPGSGSAHDCGGIAFAGRIA